MLVPSGFLAPLVTAQAQEKPFSHVLIDRQAHSCLRLAAHELGGKITSFGHCCPSDLERVLNRQKNVKRVAVLTDGVFSLSGRLAPLAEYARILPASALMLVDDAHGIGVLGENGGGSVEFFGVDRRQVIQTASLAKAFGAYGGIVIGTKQLRDAMWSKSSAFAGTTPLPLPVVDVCQQSLRIMAKNGAGLRRRLQDNICYVKNELAAGDVQVHRDPTPVFSVIPRSASAAVALQKAMHAAGIALPLINYPGGPPDGLFRFAISSAHTKANLDRLIDVLVRAFSAGLLAML
jgi:7-keto-8-aminopelargonate synthetase-like enzyme